MGAFTTSECGAELGMGRVSRWRVRRLLAELVAISLLATALSGLSAALSSGPATAQSSASLPAGRKLRSGQELSTGSYVLVMQGDGNLVEYVQEHGTEFAAWDSATSFTGAYLRVATDGLTIVRPDGAVLWSVATPGTLATFGLEANGQLVAADDQGQALWSTPAVAGASQFPAAPSSTTRDLASGEGLPANSQLVSGPWRLVMQGDGNLVAYDGSTALWANYVFSAGAYLVMQGDGNLVEYGLNGQALWSSGTSGNPGDCLIAGATWGFWVAVWTTWSEAWPLWVVTPCYSGNPGGPKVEAIGDSITNLSSPSLVGVLDPGYRYEISGQDTWTIGQQLPALKDTQHIPGGSPEDFVVNLGTNNAIQQSTNSTSRNWLPQFRQMLQMTQDRCTILVTINQFADWEGGGNVAQQINYTIDYEAMNDPHIHVIDWNNLLYDQGYASKWLSDGIHPNAAGQQALANLYVQALRQDCAA